MRKLLLLIPLFLFGCGEAEKPKNKFHRSISNKEREVPYEKVIEEKVIIKQVYVEDFSSYNVDETTTSSYWYVQYDSKLIRGYDVIEIPRNYPDIKLMIGVIKKNSGIKDDEYTQLSYFTRVPFETYSNRER